MGCPVGGPGLQGASSLDLSSRSPPPPPCRLSSRRRGSVLAVAEEGDELSTVDVDDADGLPPDFSLLLVFRGRVAEEETDEIEEGVVGESTEIVCHFSASSLKFFELGDFVLVLSFFCAIARSFGRFGPEFVSFSPFLVSWEILSPMSLLPLVASPLTLLLPLPPYFLPNSDHLPLSFRSSLISSEMAESLLKMELFLLKVEAFSDTMLLFLLERLE